MSNIQLNGATRLHFIVGDPIAQVKSPLGVSEIFAGQGMNALVIPAHVAPADLAQWAAGVALTKNMDGIIVTVPHKFAARGLCATVTPGADFLGAVNTLRRNADGSWHGDMCDGLGYVQALRKAGCEPQGQRALLVGAGGAGSAIAHALVMAGVAALDIYDADAQRLSALTQRLDQLQRCPVGIGSPDPEGYGLVINASPAGMAADDALPVLADRLESYAFVGCVVTQPAVTPLIAVARARGLGTVTGADMFAQVRDLMVEFLAEPQL